jgi:hypothetical protein
MGVSHLLTAAARLNRHLRIGLEDDRSFVVKIEYGEGVHLAGYAAGGRDGPLLTTHIPLLLLLLFQC